MYESRPQLTRCGALPHFGHRVDLAKCPVCPSSSPQWTENFDDLEYSQVSALSIISNVRNQPICRLSTGLDMFVLTHVCMYLLSDLAPTANVFLPDETSIRHLSPFCTCLSTSDTFQNGLFRHGHICAYLAYFVRFAYFLRFATFSAIREIPPNVPIAASAAMIAFEHTCSNMTFIPFVSSCGVQAF